MRIGYGALFVVAVLVIASACGRSDDDVKLCDYRGNNCRTYAFPVELNRAIAVENARQRRLAEGLPFDYRDLLHALLIEYLDPMSLHGPHQHSYVGVFGSDIDAVLTAKLRESGAHVWPASAWTLYGVRVTRGREAVRMKVDVHGIKQVGPDTFSVEISYYCGGVCAGGQTYTLQKSGDQWRIVNRQVHWNS
jgi:hypothetical protein